MPRDGTLTLSDVASRRSRSHGSAAAGTQFGMSRIIRRAATRASILTCADPSPNGYLKGGPRTSVPPIHATVAYVPVKTRREGPLAADLYRRERLLDVETRSS
jgi:hypothetical protein